MSDVKKMIVHAIKLIQDHDDEQGNPQVMDEVMDILFDVLKEIASDEQRTGNT